MKKDVDVHFVWIKRIIKEIDHFVPDSQNGTQAFRADLAGLLCVAIAAAYENSVKDSMIRHASSKHSDFEHFITKNFDRLNSRIKPNDLKKYTALFSDAHCAKFNHGLKERRKKILEATKLNCESRFEQILDWRHGYAHAVKLNTTVVEVVESHRVAKHVLYVFDNALS